MLIAVFFFPCSGRAEPGKLKIDRKTCPGECCYYGTMPLGSAQTLWAEPTTHRALATLPARAPITLLYGESRVKPIRLVVRHENADEPQFKPGETWYSIYEPGDVDCDLMFERRGQPPSKETVACLDTDVLKALQSKQAISPWASVYGDVDEADVWWAKIKTSDGKIGWLRDPDLMFDCAEYHKQKL